MPLLAWNDQVPFKSCPWNFSVMSFSLVQGLAWMGVGCHHFEHGEWSVGLIMLIGKWLKEIQFWDVFVFVGGKGGGKHVIWLVMLALLCILGNGLAKCNTDGNYTSNSEKPRGESRRSRQTLQGQSSLLRYFAVIQAIAGIVPQFTPWSLLLHYFQLFTNIPQHIVRTSVSIAK